MDTEDPTTTMNVSLPASLRTFVDSRVRGDGYTSASEYVRELIRKERERKEANAHLEELLLEGLNSGPATEMTRGDWARLRGELAQKVEERKRSR